MPSTPPYPEDLRRDAVALVRSSEKAMPQLAAEPGVLPRSLRNWVKQPALGTCELRNGLTSEEREDLRRLRRENRAGAARARHLDKSRGLLGQG
jgi:transposase